MTDIAARIKSLRGKRSQADFGKELGLEQRKISRIETGSMSIDLETTQIICKKFNVSADWLLFGKENTPDNQENATKRSTEQDDPKALIATLEAEIAMLKELLAAKDETLNAYKEVIHLTQGKLKEDQSKKGAIDIDAPASVPSAPTTNQISKD